MAGAIALGLVACSGGDNEVPPPSLDSVVTVPPTTDAPSTSASSTTTPESAVVTDAPTTAAPTTAAEAGGPCSPMRWA